MRFTAAYLALLFGLVGSTAYADDCQSALTANPALTFRQLEKRTIARIEALRKITPAPGFSNLVEEAKVEQVGEKGPQALQELLPAGVSFVNTPAPTSVHPTAVDVLEEGRAIAAHVDVPWDGRPTSTTAWVSLPRPRLISESKYLVGPEYPEVIVHLHGGGTPTATGRNALSIAKEVGKRGIPLIGIDLPGHGRATRNPEGLETFKKQVDWMMKAVKQLVDPRVKIVVSGHSWGGQFAVFMHRLSRDPNYSRISKFIALAPPVDVSLGGSLKQKMDFERWYQKEFVQFESRIAHGDFDFQKNMLDHGKESDVGTYHTNLTDLDYWTPPLTPEEQEGLKPITLWVGSADGPSMSAVKRSSTKPSVV